MREHLVSVDIGGSKIAVMARAIRNGNPVYADKIKTPAEDGVEAILKLIDEQIRSVPGGRRAMRGLGVAVPGHVDPHGHVLAAGNLRGWKDVLWAPASFSTVACTAAHTSRPAKPAT
jgi:predicted NBD/HSP70 family sugar kinase